MADAAKDYAKTAHAYARRVVKDTRGKRHCRLERLACQRHLDDLKRSKGKAYRFTFSKDHANDVCDFIEKLPHVAGQWESATIKLEPWQCFILCVVFGWRRKSDGGRRFDKAYIEIARKNAKSTLAAAVALYCLCCEGEVGPEIVIGATTGAQADKVFLPAKRMVEAMPDLAAWFELRVFSRAVMCERNTGTIQAINAKSSTQDGWNPHLAILDELHAHPNRGLHDVLESAFGARRNPLFWIITTAGYDVHGVCYEQRTLLTKVLEGVVEIDTLFGIIFTLDKDDDPLNPAVWCKANPNLGVSVSLENMENMSAKARASPDSLYEFTTKRCNVWSTAKSAYVNIHEWGKHQQDVDVSACESLPCWAGLDVAAVADFNALVLAWRQDGRTKVAPTFWLPEETVREHVLKRAGVPIKRWVDEGLVQLTPGNITDYEFIEKHVLDVLGKYNLRGLAFDPWNARDLANRLIDQGVPMVEFRQGPASFNMAMRRLEELVRDGSIDHGNHPVLTWHISNLVARTDANENRAPDRKNSHEKIDGAVAMLEAIGLMLNDTNAELVSPWENPEFSMAAM